MKAKKFLALFLALLMVASCIPFTTLTAYAASSGTGTADDPYQITSTADLKAIADDLNAWYILENDIDLSGEDWVPLGNAVNPFQGRLNGNGHTISGVTIGTSAAPSETYIYYGLFGCIGKYGVVHDLGVDAAIYNSSGYTSGILAGKSEGNIVNCHTSGTVVSTAVDCNTGGIVGVNAGNLVNSYNTANITGGSRKAPELMGIGGIAGINTGVNGITNCYNAGIISGSQAEKLGKVGAIVGYSYQGTLWNCYWDSEVNLDMTPGYDTGGAINSAVVLGLTTAYMKGAATPPKRNVYKDNIVTQTLMNVTGYVFDITGRTTLINSKFADLMNGGRGAIKPEQLPSGVKASAWGQDSGNVNQGYSVFTTASTSGVFSDGSGIITDPYIITEAGQLQDIKNQIVDLYTTAFDSTRGFAYLTPISSSLIGGYYYELANDLDLSSAKTWDPLDTIDTYTYGFNGELDGNGYRLLNFSGLSHKGYNHAVGALFKKIGPYGVVKNLGIDCNNADFESGLALYNYGLITNCQITGTITPELSASVFCAFVYGDIINCYSSADITVHRDSYSQSLGLFNTVGGFVANCAYTGNQISDGITCGFAAFIPLPRIVNCYFAGNEETLIPTDEMFSPYAWAMLQLEVDSINCYYNTSASYKKAGVEVAKQLAYDVDLVNINNLPIGISEEVMKGNTDTTIEYYDTTNNIAPPKTTNSFLEALNNGRSAVGKQFEYKTATGSITYKQQASKEELYPWVYAPGVNNDYPIPFKPQTPEITTQPSGKTITSGNTVTFYAAAASPRDGGTISYQWQKSSDGSTWRNVADGTGGASAIYTTGTLSTGNSNEKYRCVITNTRYGVTNSIATDLAVVTVKPSIYPLNPTVEAGNAITFGVDGAGPYQWQVSTDGGITWNYITDATLSYYSTAALNSGDNGSQYRCIINGTASTASTVTVTTATVTVTGVTVTPDTASVQKGGTYTFAASVTGTHNSQNVNWSVEGAASSGTGISSGGVLTVATDETGTLTVRATSVDNTSKSGTASVTVTDIPATVSSVTITPGTATVIKGGSPFTFSAAVAGTHNPNQAVTWSISGNSIPGTTISPVGELTVAANETATALTVTAVSNIDSSKFGTATVTVTSPAATVSDVTVTPNTASVAKGSTYTFSAAVNGTNNPSQSVSWSVSGNNHAGTIINGSGVLAVATGETATSLTVTATSAVSSTVFGSAIVAVTDAVSTVPTVDTVTINPPSASVVKGNNVSFAAVVTGSNSPAQTVTWEVYGGTSSGTVISSNGHLTVGTNETATTLTVMAKSSVDSSKFNIATVTVTSPVVSISNVTVTPNTADVAKGSTYTFSAEVTGTNSPSQAVSWSVSGNNKPGTIMSSSGMLAIAAGETAATLTVIATSVLDGTKSGTATVTVTDTGSNLPTVDGVMVNPATTSAEKGGTKAFTAIVTGSNSPAQTVTWSVMGNTSAGTTISNGLLTVGADETAATITVQAVSTADSTKSGTAAVTVTNSSLPAPTVFSVILSTTGGNVTPGGTKTFTATVTGTNNPSQEVTWSVSGNSSISTIISITGELTVGEDETAASLTVTAASVSDNTKSGSATITVTPLITVSSVTVSPSSGSVQVGGTKTFTATVEGTNNPSQEVTWSVSGNSRASTTISSGILTIASNETATSLTVKATSTLDSTKWGTATVTVTYPDNTTPSIGGGGGGGGGGSIVTVSPTNYNASVSGSDVLGKEITKSAVDITVNSENASMKICLEQSASITAGGKVIITIPSIPNVTEYTVGLPAESLSNTAGQGSLTLQTDAGSMVLPANMLANTGAAGKTAELSIAAGDKAALPEAAKAAIGNRPLVQLALKIDGKEVSWNNPEAPVAVSIPYTPSAAELVNPESIIIWYIDGSGNAVSVPNGHYDPASGTVTFTTTHFSNYAVGYNRVNFTDVAANDWFSKAVGFIAARKITTGTGNGNYCPDTKLTRGEFIVMLLKAYDITPDTNPKDNFTDAGNTYYTGYLAAAKRLDISEGVGNNMFVPGKEITRQEMFALLYNALKVIGRLPEGKESKDLTAFSDAGDIASWAKNAMILFVKTGTVGGSGGKLSPTATTTRAEMAQVLYNLLSK